MNGWSYAIDNQRTLMVTEISRATFLDQGLDEEFDSDGGLFLVLEDVSTGSYEVIAKVPFGTAGFSLLELVATLAPKRPALQLVGR